MKYKYASIDIETLGLDPNTCDVIEIGVVLEDLVSPVESLPSLSFYVTYPGDNYKGNAYAMAMNAGILNAIGNRHSNEGCDKTFIPVDCVDEYMFGFFKRHGLDENDSTQKILVAGKNFSGFDLPFLKSIGVGNKGSKTRFHHRTVDPGSLFFNPKVDDVPPSLDVCLERSGIDKSVDHLALNDAIDVIRVLRYGLHAQMLSAFFPYSNKWSCILEIYKLAVSESKFVRSYFDLIEQMKSKFNLSDIEAKEAVCIISDWLSENKFGEEKCGNDQKS